MATKYCEPNLYAETCEFVGSVNANGNTLTVTSVTAGRLGIGARILGLEDTYANGAFITALGTGTGGVGTYALQVNSIIAATGNRNLTASQVPPMDVPIWGVAQDGDGLAKGAATPAMASVVFGAGAASGSFSVLGVSLSPTLTSDVDANANNLAALINASTSVISFPSSFTVKGALRNHVYARGPANGAPTGTCEIMTRQGSALHNGQVAATHTVNTVSSDPITFSGGTSGAWGWIYLWSKMWPTKIAEMTYGIWGTIGTYCGSAQAGDVVKIRADRQVWGWTYTGDGFAQGTYMSGAGTDLDPVIYEVDDGTEWASPAEPVLELVMVGSGNTRWTPLQPGAGRTYLKANRYSDDKYGCVFRTAVNYPTSAPHASAPPVSPPVLFPLVMEGVHIKVATGVLSIPGTGSAAHYGVTAVAPATYLRSRLETHRNTSLVGGGASDGNGASFIARFEDTIIDAGTDSSSPDASGVFSWTGFGSTGVVDIDFENCRFLNFVIGSRFYAAQSMTDKRVRVHLRDCDMGGITVLAPVWGASTRGIRFNGVRGVSAGILSTKSYDAQDWFVDTHYGYAAWTSTRSFPTLNAKLADGVTPWSIQVIPPQVAANTTKLRGFELPRFSKRNTLGDGVRTLRVELGVEQSLTVDKGDIVVQVEYTDTTGRKRVDSSYSYTHEPLLDSDAAWTNAVGNQFSYSDSGNIYFNKKYLTLTTSQPVANNSSIGVIVSVRFSVADTTKMLFIDPEVQVV